MYRLKSNIDEITCNTKISNNNCPGLKNVCEIIFLIIIMGYYQIKIIVIDILPLFHNEVIYQVILNTDKVKQI